MSCLTNAVGSGWSPETNITRRPPFLTGPSLKRAVTIELNALTMRAPGARAATTSLAPLPPRSARTSVGLVSTKGFVASMSTRPFQAGRLFNADSTFRQGYGEQHIVEARGFLDRGRGRTTTKLGDFVDECIGTTPAAQDHFMAPGQRLSPKCERDSAGADRAKLHVPLLSFEKS